MKKNLFSLLLSIFLACAFCVSCQSPHAHNYTPSVSLLPTCTEEGFLLYSCPCGDSYTQPIPALGHEVSVSPELSPTCTLPGHTASSSCTRCGAILVPQEELAPLGHLYENDICVRCGISRQTWDQTADLSWYDDSRSEFTLSSAQQLAGLAQLVNAGISFHGKRVCLGTDIYLNEIENYAAWEYIPPQNTWTPIGTRDTPFEGIFDGNGHTIFGLYRSGGDHVGLFGFIQNAIVSNFSVRNSCCEGSSYVGVIAEARKSTIGYLTASESLFRSSQYYCGMIAYCESGKIAECKNEATFVGYCNGTGGIAGYSSGEIRNCVGNGTVTAEDDKVGSVVGYLYYASMENCTGVAPLCGFLQN